MSPEEVDRARIERQIERGALFTHTALRHNAARINEIESFLYAVIDVLVQKGIAVPMELTQAAHKVQQELAEREEDPQSKIHLRVDDGVSQAFVPVNCNERLHLCQAVCCKLSFALTAEEVESGKIKWDLGRPYLIRRETTDYCTHMNLSAGCCKIYDDRPGVCRKYSCANDSRIWNNFERMELNHEWINQHTQQTDLQLTEMFPDSRNQNRS